jgi:hypothetical protein
MAAPSYATDLTDITLAESTTGWSALGGGASGLAVGPDFAMQGTNCVDKQVTGAEKGQVYDPGANVTIASGRHVFTWIFLATPGVADTLANRGLTVAIGSSTTAYCKYHVEGSDTYGAAGRVARCYPVDPSLNTANTGSAPYRTRVGTPSGAYRVFGGLANILGTVKGSNLGIDAIRHGTGLFVTGGDVTPNGPATFAGLAAQNDAIANRWGVFTDLGGTYELQGGLNLGQTSGGAASAVRFVDSNVNIVVPDNPHVGSAFNQILIYTAGTVVDWSNVNIDSQSGISPCAFGVLFASPYPTVTLTNCVFTGMGLIQLRPSSEAIGCTFRRCQSIDLNNGGQLTSCLIDKSTVAQAVQTTDLSTVDDCTFVSDGTGHAVDLGTVSATTSMNWNCTDTGYAATNGSTGNETIVVNVASGQTLTINVAAGASIPTYRNTGTGTVTVVSGQVTTTITVVDVTDGSPLQNARVYLVAGAGGPLTAGTVIFNTLTDSSGQVSDIRSLATDQPVIGWVRKASRGSLRVDSDTDVLQRTANLPSTTAFTLMGYAQRVSNRSGSTLPQILCKLQDATNANSYSLTWAGLDGLQLWKRTGGVSNQTNFTYEPAIGEWFAFAITASGTAAGTHKGYVWPLDTLAAEVQSTSGIAFTPSFMTVGTHPSTATNWADVRLANVRAWDTALSQAELEAELLTQAPVRTANLNTAWVDDGVDISGNGRNWTITDTTFSPLSPYPIAPFYKSSPLTGTIDNAVGLSLTAQMIRDE